jgi:hypothetical protein
MVGTSVPDRGLSRLHDEYYREHGARVVRSSGMKTMILNRHTFIVAVALLALQAACAAEVRRCEDSSGRVTYSNEACPTGTSRERGVDDRPPVEVGGTAEKSGDKAPHSGKASTSGVVPGAGPDRYTPEQAREMSQEQRKSLLAHCDDLVHRIEFGQQDLLSAAPGERASMELGLRRLQEEHKANCAPRGSATQ